MVTASSNPFLLVAIGTVMLITRAVTAFAQMGTRPEQYYEEGGWQDDTTGFLALIFTFAFWFFVIRAIVKSLQKSEREEYQNIAKRTALEIEFNNKKDQRRETVGSSNATPHIDSPQRPLEKTVLYHLRDALSDEDASFYIIGADERPIAVWLRLGVAADFSKKLVEEVSIESIFGGDSSMSLFDGEEVSAKSFRNRVLEVHSDTLRDVAE
jgi:hypothetical protein